MTRPPSYLEAHGLLEGKVVLVTAAAGAGIGFATAKRCAEEGAELVVISDTHERRLGEAAEQLEAATGRRPLAVRCDVTVEADVQQLFDATVAEAGRVDVAVNNAGLGGTANLVDMTDEQHCDIVARYFRLGGGWGDPVVERRTPPNHRGDPLFAVWAYRLGTTDAGS